MRQLPMFPLGTVLFPYATLPLHVFEPRYRIMVRACLRDDHEFGVVLIERGSEVGGGDVRFPVGTLARIVHATELPDGRFALTAVGTRRLRVVEWLPDDPYPQANVEVDDDADTRDALDESDGRNDDARERVERALRRFFDVWSTFEPRVREIDTRLSPQPARASYEAAALAPLGPLDAQRVLEEQDTASRLALLETLVADGIELLEARRREP
jgi:Lon protease-like protein